ncbi:hypothetical protein QCN27_19245 [Cereibacter sp. SYSU M97828]|nr:hypothetical protein [Cereibacter flavus]
MSGRIALAASLSLISTASLAAEALRVDAGPPPQMPNSPAARLFTDDGFERALARDLGKAMGRPVTLVAEGADIVLHHGAEGALVARQAMTVAMRTDTDIASWDDLRGRTLCLADTNAAGIALAAELGALPVPQSAPALSLMRVRTGECDAALHDAGALAALFADPDWAKFSATLPPREVPALRATASPALLSRMTDALAAIASPAAWQIRNAAWARDVALEVWLEQDAPDCH